MWEGESVPRDPTEPPRGARVRRLRRPNFCRRKGYQSDAPGAPGHRPQDSRRRSKRSPGGAARSSFAAAQGTQLWEGERQIQGAVQARAASPKHPQQVQSTHSKSNQNRSPRQDSKRKFASSIEQVHSRAASPKHPRQVQAREASPKHPQQIQSTHSKSKPEQQVLTHVDSSPHLRQLD